MHPFYSSLIASLIVSCLSFVGIFFLFIRLRLIQKITLFLVSFAVGGLLGDAFIHLIPQAFESVLNKTTSSLLILLGILIFFILEKILLWHHCHEVNCHQESKHIVTLNIVGDSVHNFIDGALIAASFNLSFLVGFATTIAVILHEIPQEIGDFGIMLHHGYSVSKIFFYNFISALTSILGVSLIFLFNLDFSSYLIPITAGGFIYLAATDLIPELHRHDSKISTSIIQLVCILIGISLMFGLTFLE
jgi:zinc and cadmium transporter